MYVQKSVLYEYLKKIVNLSLCTQTAEVSEPFSRHTLYLLVYVHSKRLAGIFIVLIVEKLGLPYKIIIFLYICIIENAPKLTINTLYCKSIRNSSVKMDYFKNAGV